MNEEDDTSNTADTLRATLRSSYPEIDELFSDSYINAVLSVPNRTYQYALNEKIRGALDWRRSYNVDSLVAAFQYDESNGTLRLADDQSGRSESEHKDNPNIVSFSPSQSLIDVSMSGAFSLAGFDNEGRGILHSRTGLLDWWRTGVEDGIRYHILVIEHALKKAESLVLCVDTSDLPYIPPPMSTFTEMASLMQRAYPDRIHKIHIGPVNGLLRKLYEMVSPYLRPRSRDKIKLLDCAPSLEKMGQ